MLAESVGVVPTEALRGKIGILKRLLDPFVIELGLVQVTTCPLTVQLHPLLVNDPAGGFIPEGIVTLVEIGPVAGAVPIFETVTGILEETPAVSVGIVPIVVTKSGAGAAETGEPAVAVLVLLFVTVSPDTGVAVAENCGVLPTAELLGVIGTLNVLLDPLFKGPAVVQFTTCAAVVQLQPLLENDAEGVIPLGTVSEAEIIPVAGAVPMFPTVTGMLEVTPAVKVGILPMLVTKSGAGAAETGDPDVAVLELLLTTVSFETGVTLAENCGLVPTEVFVGVTCILKLLVEPVFIGPAIVQFTT